MHISVFHQQPVKPPSRNYLASPRVLKYWIATTSTKTVFGPTSRSWLAFTQFFISWRMFFCGSVADRSELSDFHSNERTTIINYDAHFCKIYNVVESSSIIKLLIRTLRILQIHRNFYLYRAQSFLITC